ncbi:hypothetical protein Cni_G05011 [Canna indica]|uniref:Uncharacterized protein n=1 Tax=Canna indica TaxID=4628 RepID=A0AAQ3JU00_9LILI|nr:hypothetical protein Cni_G05011 [Canna indica]
MLLWIPPLVFCFLWLFHLNNFTFNYVLAFLVLIILLAKRLDFFFIKRSLFTMFRIGILIRSQNIGPFSNNFLLECSYRHMPNSTDTYVFSSFMMMSKMSNLL